MNNKQFILVLSLVLAHLSSCSKGPKLGLLEEKGRAVFMANCSMCHNPDPRFVGSVGPDIAHASLELITARVLFQAYPPNYKPKRQSQLMPPLPFLKNDLLAIHAFLNSFPRPK